MYFGSWRVLVQLLFIYGSCDYNFVSFVTDESIDSMGKRKKERKEKQEGVAHVRVEGARKLSTLKESIKPMHACQACS
jgi:hypothetical protein